MKGLMGYADGSILPPSESRSLQSQGTATPETSTLAPTSNPFDLTPYDSQRTLTQSTGAVHGITSDEEPWPYLQMASLPTGQEEEWSCLDAAAAAQITLIIKSQLIQMKFLGTAPAAEIWSSLCARFERTSDIIALQARNRLNGCKYTDGHDLQSHLDKMTMSWEDASAAGAKIPDDEFCHILRASFPPRWAPLLATLFTVGDPIFLESSLLAFAGTWGQPPKPRSPTSSTIPASSFARCTNCGKGGGAEHSAPHRWRTRDQVQRPQGPPRAKTAPVDTSIPSSYPLDSSTHSIASPSATAQPWSPYNPFRQRDCPINPSRLISSDPGASLDRDTPIISGYRLFGAAATTRPSVDQ